MQKYIYFLKSNNKLLILNCLWHTNFLYLVLKLGSIAYGTIFNVCPVVVNGVDAIVQKLGYLAAV